MLRRVGVVGLLAALLWVGSVLSTPQVADAGIEWCCSPPPMVAGIAPHPVTPKAQPNDFTAAPQAYQASANGMSNASQH